jgi:hypothetical protein
VGYAPAVKIGDWDSAGAVAAIVPNLLAELGAKEIATHVASGQEGRLRILVATDIGLMDYHYHPSGANPNGPWSLRGDLVRWAAVRGLRLQTEAQVEQGSGTVNVRWIWRFVGEEPKIEMTAESTGSGERAPAAVLPLARTCIELAARP